jgi:hypothetical protein
MEVTYQLERTDHLEYNRFVVNRVPALKRQAFFQMLGIPLIFGFEFVSFHLTWYIYIPLILVSGTLWNVYLLWVRRRAVVAQTQTRPGAIGLHTFKLGPDGVREQTTVIEAFARWAKVTEIAENKQLIVFFLGPRYGFLIPKRAFPSAEDAQVFLDTARAFRSSSLNGTVPSLPEIRPSWPPAPQRFTK